MHTTLKLLSRNRHECRAADSGKAQGDYTWQRQPAEVKSLAGDEISASKREP
jgi:hypothetical protein